MPGPALRQRVQALLADRGAWYRRRRVLVPVAALAIYALLGFLLVPVLVRHQVPVVLRDALGAQATLGEVRVNPFLFTLEAREFALADATGEPLLRLGRLFVDVELSSLFRRAWTFADIRLEQPELDLVHEADGQLNLQRVLAALPAAADAPAEPPPRVLVLHAAMPGARLRYSDRRRDPQPRAEIGPIDLLVDRVATLESHRGPVVLKAVLPGGGTLAWEGFVSLNPVASSGALRLSGFEPRAVWDFLQPSLRLGPPQGSVDATLGYEAALVEGELALKLDPIAVSVRDLVLQRIDSPTPLLRLAGVDVGGASLDLATRTLKVAELGLREGHLAAVLDRAGVADWSTLVVEEPAPAAAGAPAAGDAQAWRVEFGRIAVAGLGAEVYDQSRHAPLGFALLARSADFAAALSLGAQTTQIGVSDATLELADIALTTGAERAPLGRIARLAVAGAGADVGAQRVSAQRIALEGIVTAIHRDADGSIREFVLASAPDPAVPLPVSSAAAEWQLAAGEISLTGIDAAYSDAMTDPPLAYAVQDGRIVLREVQTASAAPIAVDATLPLAEGGSVALVGNVAGDGSTAELQLSLAQLAMVPMGPLVAQQTTLKLESGALSAEAAIAYRATPEGAPVVGATGTFGIDGLLLTEAATGERFLAWRSLAATGVDFALNPDRLQVRELKLVEPGAKIVVYKDRTTNLAQVMREVPADPAANAEMAAATAAVEPFPVLVDRVRVDGATVDFADHTLVLPFAARIERLKGVARGISTAADSRATLKFAGRVGEFGEAEIDGQLAPFDPTRYTDVEVSFRNIAMTQLSPYSATFAGRAIAGGDLDLDLEYEVAEGVLAGENRVLLQDFRLGENVESAEATDLPLDLAIALLTDAEGRIELAVPVSGNVGDPQFSYGHLVGQALGNVLRGIVTAPFRALGSVFGGAQDGEAMHTIRFASGSAELMPREQERIAKLAEALAARPQLGLGVPSGIEPERDGYAVRRLQVRRAHAALLEVELEPGEDPGPVSYDGAKSQHALERLLEAREGEDAADAFAAGYAARSGGEPERVNAALALLGRGAGDAAYYRELYLHLVNSTPEPRAELEALAAARVQAIRAQLLARGIADARLRAVPPATLEKAKSSGVLLPLALVAID